MAFKDMENPYSYDIEDAAAVLEEAGYADTDGDGIIETPDGTPVVLEVYSYTTRAELPIICEALQYAAGTLGIQLNLNYVQELWADTIQNGSYDLCIFNSSGFHSGDAAVFLQQYFKSDPVTAMYSASGSMPSEAVLEATREELGLNDPFLVQYWNWLTGCLHGDFGTSYSMLKPVLQLLSSRLLPLVTMLGLSLGSLLGGTAVVEVIFSYPGLGNLAVTSISARDYPMIQGYVLWIALIYMGINLIVDISYDYLDPRIRESQKIPI